MNEYAVFWFRRDLRLEDNHGLYKALSSGLKLIPLFIFDKKILDKLPAYDGRVDFIHRQLVKLQSKLQQNASSLVIHYGNPIEVWKSMIDQYPIVSVYTNHDYEPYAVQRDASIAQLLEDKGISFHTFKDQVLYEKREILSNAEKPYTVFTPYCKKWKAALDMDGIEEYPSEDHLGNCWTSKSLPIPSLESMGFHKTSFEFPEMIPDAHIVEKYHEQRNFPAVNGTTRLGIHLRFGTISLRRLANMAKETNQTYLNELIWREFYMQILWNFPHVVSGPFKKAYEAIPWSNDEASFKLWCEGKTGFPIVDAGMRELNETGYMHNRVRMITASFLVKDLLINWQRGEAYFAEKLLDFELSSNNGGWQWASGLVLMPLPIFASLIQNPNLKNLIRKANTSGNGFRSLVARLIPGPWLIINGQGIIPWKCSRMP